MKKVLLAFAVLFAIGGTATAQEASKSKQAPKTRAQATAAKKTTAVAQSAEAAENIVVAETDGKNEARSQAVVEAEKARRMDAEKAKSKKN